MCRRLPAQQHDDGITLRRNEPKHKDVLTTAIVAFRRRLAKRGLGMQNDFLMLSAHEMIDNMRGGSVPAGIAEPFAADEALHNRGWVVNTTVTGVAYEQGGMLNIDQGCAPACMRRQFDSALVLQIVQNTIQLFVDSIGPGHSLLFRAISLCVTPPRLGVT